jgi:hypothetical protein
MEESNRIEISDDPMLNALHGTGPATDRAGQMMLYGQFIGSWEGHTKSKSFHVDANGEIQFDDKSSFNESTLEVHFGWVLEGRVIQDVWISPERKEGNDAAKYGMYGTTIRVYDPKNDQWYITFIDPFTTQSYHRMIGRKIGNDIVQEYRREGVLTHWIFTDITDDSFHWMWKESTDDGKSWKVQAEFFLHRRHNN